MEVAQGPICMVFLVKYSILSLKRSW